MTVLSIPVSPCFLVSWGRAAWTKGRDPKGRHRRNDRGPRFLLCFPLFSPYRPLPVLIYTSCLGLLAARARGASFKARGTSPTTPASMPLASIIDPVYTFPDIVFSLKAKAPRPPHPLSCLLSSTSRRSSWLVSLSILSHTTLRPARSPSLSFTLLPFLLVTGLSIHTRPDFTCFLYRR